LMSQVPDVWFVQRLYVAYLALCKWRHWSSFNSIGRSLRAVIAQAIDSIYLRLQSELL